MTKVSICVKNFGLIEKNCEIGNKIINETNSNVSGGEKQKIAIIRQLISNPDVLLFDEPTSALDEESKNFFIKYLKKIKDGHIVILVTHDKDLVRECDAVLAL